MSASRGIKRKRGLARPLQEKVDIPLELYIRWLSLRNSQSQAQLTPEQIFPGKLVRKRFIRREGKGNKRNLTMEAS